MNTKGPTTKELFMAAFSGYCATSSIEPADPDFDNNPFDANSIDYWAAAWRDCQKLSVAIARVEAEPQKQEGIKQ